MTVNTPIISGAHRTMLIHELLQAGIVVLVVVAATVLTLVKTAAISSDLLSFVYGGAITYAGGRAAASRQALSRGSAADQGDLDDAAG